MTIAATNALAFWLFLSIMIQTTHGFSAFVPAIRRPARRGYSAFCCEHQSFLRHAKDDNEENDDDGDDDEINREGEFFFDDFGGRLIGEEDDIIITNKAAAASTTTLSDRMQQLQNSEIRQEAVYTRNWNLGNWQVRGFSLEDEDDSSTTEMPTSTTTSTAADNEQEEDEVGEDIRVRRGGAPEKNADDDAPLSSSSAPAVCRIVKAVASEDDGTTAADVWVGRTDGSVFGVKLGSAYWTKLQTTTTSSGDDSDTTTTTSSSNNEKPFEIVARVDATAGSSSSSPVSALVAAATSSPSGVDEELTYYLFTATDSAAAGDIQQWTTTVKNESSKHEMVLSKQLQGVHDTSVLWMKKAVVSLGDDEDDRTVLLSACRSKIAVWDLVTGDLLGQCAVVVEEERANSASDDTTDDDGRRPAIIQCVDTDGTHVYVGTTTGHVVAYSIQDIILSAGDDDDASSAVAGQWRASNDAAAVTAVSCGGAGSLGRGRGSETVVLYTGDERGVIKQWEVFARRITTTADGGQETTKIEQWPKMATQRLPKKAHLFQGHQGRINEILAVDAVKFVSASSDGTGTCHSFVFVGPPFQP